MTCRRTAKRAARAVTAILSAAALTLASQGGMAGAGKQKSRHGAVPSPVEQPLPPDLVAPDRVLEKDLSKELARGTILGQLESKGNLAKSLYTPPPKLLEPYHGAALGSAVAYEIVEDDQQFVYAPAAQAYAQAVVNRMIAKLPGVKPVVPVYVIAKPYYGASAMPSGVILINIGTFNADNTKGSATTDELALLLGHELGHLLLGHMEASKGVRTIGRMVSYSASAMMAYSSVKGGHFANGKFQGQGDKKLMLQGLVAGLASSTLVQDLLAPSFSRNRELEADRIGIDLAHRADFVVSEGEVLRFVSKHAEDSLRRARRIEILRGVVDTMMAEVATKTSKEAGNAGTLVKDLIATSSQAVSEQIVKFVVRQTKEHPDPDERKAFDAQYVRHYYADAGTASDGRLLKRDAAGMSALCHQLSLTGTLNQVRRAVEVRDALTQAAPSEDDAAQMSQMRTMLKQAGVASAAAPAVARETARTGKKQAIATVRPTGGTSLGVDDAAMTWEVQGTLYVIDGATGEAQGAWRRGLRSDYASVLMARNFGGTISGSSAERDALIARYTRLIGTADPVLDQVVAAAVARNDMVTAEVEAAHCATYAEGRFYPFCAVALGYDPLLKGQSAQTPEGRRAFASKGLERSFRTLKTMTKIFD